MDCLDRAISKFNKEKKERLPNGRCGELGHYGKWDDDWNIHNVLYDALKFYTIDKLFNTRQHEDKSGYY